MIAAEVVFSNGDVVKNCEVYESEKIEGYLDITFPTGRKGIVNKTDITCIYEDDSFSNEY